MQNDQLINEINDIKMFFLKSPNNSLVEQVIMQNVFMIYINEQPAEFLFNFLNNSTDYNKSWFLFLCQLR